MHLQPGSQLFPNDAEPQSLRVRAPQAVIAKGGARIVFPKAWHVISETPEEAVKEEGHDLGTKGEIVVGDEAIGVAVILTYAKWTGAVPEHQLAVDGLMEAVSAAKDEAANHGKVLHSDHVRSPRAITLHMEDEADDLHELGVLVGLIDRDGRTRNLGAKCVYRASAPAVAVAACRAAIGSFSMTIADKDLELIEQR